MFVKSVIATLILVFVCIHAPARAGDAVFPVACQPGMSCFILSYPDMDKAPGSAKDYMCGGLAQDDDPMLRIGMGSIEHLRNPVDVMATRDGVVLEARDGAKDLVITSRQQLRQGASLCGNGVVIDHGAGLQSAYCHLRAGSVRVKAGDAVKAGDVIGWVGQSGFATWPQLGFSMQSSGVMLDPVTSMSSFEGCGFKPRPMIPLPPAFMTYNPVSIISLGFSDKAETSGTMMMGTASHLPRFDSEAQTLNFWAMLIGVRRGDEITISLYDTRGRRFEHQIITAEIDEDRTPINVPRARGYAGWRAGIYTADITVTRTIKGQPFTVTRRATTVVP